MKIQVNIVVEDVQDSLLGALQSLWAAIQESPESVVETVIFDNGLSPSDQKRLQALVQRELIAWHGYPIRMLRTAVRRSRSAAHLQCLHESETRAQWLFPVSQTARISKRFFKNINKFNLSSEYVWIQPTVVTGSGLLRGLRLNKRAKWLPVYNGPCDYPCHQNFLVDRKHIARSFDLRGRISIVQAGKRMFQFDEGSVEDERDAVLRSFNVPMDPIEKRMQVLGIEKIGLIDVPFWMADAIQEIWNYVTHNQYRKAARQATALKASLSQVSWATKRSRFNPDLDVSSIDI